MPYRQWILPFCIKTGMNLQRCLKGIQSRYQFEQFLLKAVLSTLSERDETADICVDNKGNPEPDTELRDTENVPLKRTYEYFEREVKPHVPDAWIDESKTKIGYEIPLQDIFINTSPKVF